MSVPSSSFVRFVCAVWLLAACGKSSTGDPPRDVPAVGDGADAAADAATDTGAHDVTMDAPEVADAATPDAPADAADDVAADAARPCASNADCTGNPAGAVCDTSTGRCVECTPTNDTCPADRHCVAGMNACAAGCRSDEGCAVEGDGGVAARRCDTATNTCVECTRDEHCPLGRLCTGSLCVVGCNPDRGCAAGLTCCAGVCIDPMSNTAHCGACDNRCVTPNAAAACLNGGCSVMSCNAPFGNCDGMSANGCETNTLNDPSHCGGCGMACVARPNARATCGAGSCDHTCNAGFADCDGVSANGCETDLNADPRRCGSCSNACNPPNATAVCRTGACALDVCNTGFADCDTNPTNGCEVDTRTTVSNCGRCGAACSARPNTVPGCVSGACVQSCVTGFQDCDGDAMNGCEADVRSDRTNCGACGRSCATGAGTTGNTCSMGRCNPTCATGFADCDMNADNGCEAPTLTSSAHCGMCGRACPTGQACVAGSCSATTSCRTLYDAGMRTDGTYTILINGAATQVQCLMSADGGGWTMVMNHPTGTAPSSIPTWNSGAAVGGSFTDVSRPFRLSDAAINALRTNGFRARGRATSCVNGPCNLDVTVYWRGTCDFSSTRNSPACSTAYYDLAFTRPTGNTSPCSWHQGLVDTNCSSRGGMITNHTISGVLVCTGDPGSFTHSCAGRGSENPSVQVWVR